MTRIIERFVYLLRATVMALYILSAISAPAEDMIVREGHQNRCTHLNDDQSNYRDLLSGVQDHR
jgi:hypothetical protein